VLCGSDVVLALTYYAHRDKMRVVGRERDVEELNRAAVRLARKVAAERDSLVAGNISNTWVYDPNDPGSTGATVRRMYDEQIGWAKEEGVDFILAETLDQFSEARIALEAIKAAGLPAVVNLITLEGTTKDGYEFDEACRILHEEGADVVGLNCGRGPETMLPMLEKVVARVTGPVAALPVAYRTTPAQPTFLALHEEGRTRAFPINLERFLASRFDMADFAVKARDMGVRMIGVCCGGAPYHVRAMAEALGRTVPASAYSPVLQQHAIFGDTATVKDHTRKAYEEIIKA
jgi:betaine-homocysteine S-methyltransferase